MGRQGNLRQPKGYAGLESARKLLNDMIYEAAMKYDEEIASCTDFNSKKCSALEKGQSDVLASNFIAASSRTLMSVASGIIERMTQEIASTKITLAEHIAQCKKQRRELTTRLEIVLGDIEVLTTILEMTDCKANKALLQLRRCHNECTKENTIEFAHHKFRPRLKICAQSCPRISSRTPWRIFSRESSQCSHRSSRRAVPQSLHDLPTRLQI